jgi:hypothetical protein
MTKRKATAAAKARAVVTGHFREGFVGAVYAGHSGE